LIHFDPFPFQASEDEELTLMLLQEGCTAFQSFLQVQGTGHGTMVPWTAERVESRKAEIFLGGSIGDFQGTTSHRLSLAGQRSERLQACTQPIQRALIFGRKTAKR